MVSLMGVKEFRGTLHHGETPFYVLVESFKKEHYDIQGITEEPSSICTG